MAVITYVYLLDVDGFRSAARPAIQGLLDGDPLPLRELAGQFAKSRPDVWHVLAGHKLYPSDLGFEDEEFPDEREKLNLWLMTILAGFLAQIATPRVSSEMRELLPHLDLSDMEVEKLLVGDPQITLLLPDLMDSPIASRTRIREWPLWCQFGQLPALTGWLSLADVELLLKKLSERRQTVVEGVNQRVLAEYDALLNELRAADGAQSGLFTAVTM